MSDLEDKVKDDEKGTEDTKQSSTVDKDTVLGFLETEEGQKIVQSKVDRIVKKQQADFETKTVPKLVQDNLKQTLKGLFPDVEDTSGKDPNQVLKEQVDTLMKERDRGYLLDFTNEYANQLGIDPHYAKEFMGLTKEETQQKLDKLSEYLEKQKATAVDSFTKSNSRDISDDSSTPLSKKETLQQQLKEAQEKGDMVTASSLMRQLSTI